MTNDEDQVRFVIALAAMHALISSGCTLETWESVAEKAYKISDAMIKEGLKNDKRSDC